MAFNNPGIRVHAGRLMMNEDCQDNERGGLNSLLEVFLLKCAVGRAILIDYFSAFQGMHVGLLVF